MPTPPSLAGQMSPPAPRITRRSTSRSVQPEQAASGSKRKREPDLDDDLFGDGPFDDQQVVDLVDKDEVPVEILNSQEQKKNYTRMSTFDCVICMDSVKDLTVTHCGKFSCLLMAQTPLIIILRPSLLLCVSSLCAQHGPKPTNLPYLPPEDREDAR
jgi:E3 ubiquitin-protein ligase RNF5